MTTHAHKQQRVRTLQLCGSRDRRTARGTSVCYFKSLCQNLMILDNKIPHRNSGLLFFFGWLQQWRCDNHNNVIIMGRVSAVCRMELTFMYFFSDRSDVEFQAADVGDGGPAREGAPRHEKERLRGWEVEWLWGQSSVWRIY